MDTFPAQGAIESREHKPSSGTEMAYPWYRRAWDGLVERHYQVVLFVLLGIGTLVIYWPSLVSYFISDDFQYVGYLFFTKTILNGDVLKFWFIEGMDGGLYFRPVGHAFMLVDYMIGGTNPLGYHLTNIIFHLLSSIEVFLLTRLLVRKRSAAAIAAICFALLPVHAEAVSWIAARYDVIGGFFYLAALIFFVLFRQRGNRWSFLLSLAAFGLALGSKETALSLPLVLLLYDALFYWKRSNLWNHLIYHLPFWLLLAARFSFFGRGYRGFQVVPEGLWYWLDWNIANLFQPLGADAIRELRWAVGGAAILLLVLYRFRRDILWAIAFIPLTMAATFTSGPSDRSLYIPSIGLALVVGLLFDSLMARRSHLIRLFALAAITLVFIGEGTTLFLRNQGYYHAGEVAAAIPQQVRLLHPTLPPDARLVFVGVPDQVPEGPLVYITGFERSIQMAYGSAFRVSKFGKFPLWLDQLDRTYFFELDHRRVRERSDLVQELRNRETCSSSSQTAERWDFAKDTQGWEPWNQLEGFQSHGGALVARSEGNDPSMGSPSIDIPSLTIGELQISMSVLAERQPLQGEIYWMVSGQQDFSPGLRESFAVQGDGVFHTYTINLAKSNKLAIGDRIVQFRLDPVDAPAQIAIRSIRAFVACSSPQDQQVQSP